MSPDFLDKFIAERTAKNPDFPALVESALRRRQSGLDLTKCQLVPKRDVDAALLSSKELAAVVVKLSRLVEEQAKRIEALDNRVTAFERGSS